MKIRTKLLIAYLVVSALVVAVLHVGFVASRTADMAFREMSVHGIPVSNALHALHSAALRVVASTSEYLFLSGKHPGTPNDSGDEIDSKNRERELITGGTRDFLQALERYGTASGRDITHGSYSAEILQAGRTLILQSHELIRATDKGAAYEHLLDRKEIFESAETRLIQLIDTALSIEERELNRDIAQSIVELTRLREHYISLLVFLLVSAAVTAMAVTTFFSRPMRLLAERAQRIAREDDNHHEEPSDGLDGKYGQNEIDELNGAFDAMERRLADSRAHLRRHKDDLEIKIAERTSELEDTVRRAETLAREASAASETKAAFLANMSHEIRTPLNGVLGTAELLSHTELNRHQSALVETISRSGDSLLRIINDILDFSKIDAGRLDLELAPFSPGNTLEEVVTLLAPGANNKQIEFVADLDPEAYVDVLGDAGRLRQIALNLVSNAIKFTEHGYVQLRARAVEVPGSAMEFTIEVEDTGIGISAQSQQHLFQSFSQADASTTRRFGGTGLGLAISRQLAELMNGSLELRSDEGKGTQFTLRVILPRVARPHSTRATGFDLRVLLYQPEAHARAATLRQMRDLGVHAESTVSLQETLEAANRQHFDLILAEGLESEDGTRLSVIATQQGARLISISGMQHLRESANSSLETAQLTKPVTRTQLLHCLPSPGVGIGAPRANGGSGTVAEETTPLGQSMNVLLAEDNAVNRMVATQMLKRLGVSHHAVHNGVEALVALEERTFDLVLMDCHMPEMDGYVATGHIREREALTEAVRIPVIALTAGALKGDRERALDAGMDDYLTKPVSLKALRAILTKWAPQNAATATDDNVSSV